MTQIGNPMIAQEVARSDRDGSSESPRVLIVDDDLNCRAILRALGRKAGFECTEASNFDEAEQVIRKRAFDCVTLDLSLGQNYGLEVVRLLGDIGSKSSIIVVSAAGDAVSRLAMSVGRSMGLTFCPPVPKPIDFAVMTSLLQDIRDHAPSARSAVS